MQVHRKACRNTLMVKAFYVLSDEVNGYSNKIGLPLGSMFLWWYNSFVLSHYLQNHQPPAPQWVGSKHREDNTRLPSFLALPCSSRSRRISYTINFSLDPKIVFSLARPTCRMSLPFWCCHRRVEKHLKG
jgi:hypothetical protein